MSSLPIGANVTVPELDGRWSVWSQTDDTPGAYAVVPSDDEARRTGFKYAIVRAIYPKGADKPSIKLVRTDPERSA